MNLKDIKVVFIIPGLIVALVLVYATFLWVTYIDVRVESGQAYGFNIGDSKVEVFENAKNQFKSKTIYFLHPLDNRNYGPLKIIAFDEEDYLILSKREVWELFYKKNYADFIKFRFENNKLISIYRHRQKFELP